MAALLVYNIESATPTMISSLDRHCVKRIPDGSSNIDPKRSHLNRLLEGHKDGLSASLKALYESGVKKPAAQAEAPYLRIVLSASPEYFRPNDPDAVGTWQENLLATWEEATMHQIRTEFGEDLIFAELHLDEDTPHIHAVVAPTYLRKARVPGKQRRDETPEQFEARKEVARASEGIRTVGRSSHPTLSKRDSFKRLRERMAIAIDHLGIEYGEDRSIDAPEGQSTREYVIQTAAKQRKEEAKLKQERAALEQEREDLKKERELIDNAKAMADEQWARADEAREAESAARASRDALQAEAEQIRQRALEDAEVAAKDVLDRARKTAAEEAERITQETSKRLEATLLSKDQKALLAAERERDKWKGAFELLRDTLKRLLPEQLYQEIKRTWQNLWDKHPKNTDRKPDPPSPSNGPSPQ